MCGYIGAISYKRDYKNIIQNANKNLICRGPDNLSALNINDNLFINLYLTGYQYSTYLKAQTNQ